MKKIYLIIFLSVVSFSCGEAQEKTNNQNPAQEDKKQIQTENNLQSGDYSSFFTDFECNVSAAEVAKVLNIPEADVSVPEYKRSEGCSFAINGFGQNGLGDETIIQWFLEKANKEDVKKEIQTYTEMQENNRSLGMGIEKSEAGDTYLAKSPRYGRVIVLNENYANWLVINYSPKGTYKTRTEEQHAALGTKMIDLANYLLSKHKK